MKSSLKGIIAAAMILITLSVSGQFITEDFESNIFPPANWTIASQNTNETWSLETKAANTGTNSAKVNYDDNFGAQNEILKSPSIDLTSAINPSLEFWFSMSYFWSISPNNNYDFEVSIYDGSSLKLIWQESDFGNFNNYDWYKVTLDLTEFAGKSNISVEFKYQGQDGANLRIDDFSIKETAVLDVEKLEENNLSFYPNPTKNTLSYNSNIEIDEIIFYNTIGQEVKKSTNNVNQIDISNLDRGIYTLKVKSANKIETYKILKE